jgi:hypothetical protein
MSFSNILKSEFINNTLQKANTLIEEDRKKYMKIWEITNKYCKDNNLILSNKNKLFGIKNIDEQYNIYTTDVFIHAVNLTNELHKNIEEKLINLNTIKSHEELCIYIDSRPLINLFILKKYPNINIMKIIYPVKINDLYYFPPEIEIIDLYNDLYNPSKFSEWEKIILNEESKLFNLILERKKEGIYGASECKILRKELVEILKIDIIQKVLNDKNIIIIGIWANNIIHKGLLNICADEEKIQIITNKTPDDIIDMIQSKIDIKHKIIAKTQDLNIPKDFRTNRVTLYLQIKTNKGTIDKPFLDIFNSTTFELIPYYQLDNINIGSKYVLIKFLFIDLWIVRIVEKLGYLDKKITNEKINRLLGLIQKFRNSTDPLIKYQGLFRDYSIDKKIFNMQNSLFKPKYIPEKYLKENGKYYTIEKKV